MINFCRINRQYIVRVDGVEHTFEERLKALAFIFRTKGRVA